jgi:alpha-1,4-galacturonosyltransferase
MVSPKRLPYTTADAGGRARRGPGTVPPVVVLVFLFGIAPSIFFVIVPSITTGVTEQ